MQVDCVNVPFCVVILACIIDKYEREFPGGCFTCSATNGLDNSNSCYANTVLLARVVFCL